MLLFGAYFISTKGETLIPRIGDVLILMTAVCYGSVTVFSKKIINRNSPEHLSFHRSLAGGVTLLLISAILGFDLIQSKYIPFVLLDGIVVALLVSDLIWAVVAKLTAKKIKNIVIQ